MLPKVSYMALPDIKKQLDEECMRSVVTDRQIMENIIDTVSKCLDVDPVYCLKKTRKREVVYFRQLCIYLIYKNTSLSLAHIGQRFGGRDHTTVIHCRDAIKDFISINDEKVINDLNKIKKLYETLYGSTSHNKLY